jgi:hypothetical protein
MDDNVRRVLGTSTIHMALLGTPSTHRWRLSQFDAVPFDNAMWLQSMSLEETRLVAQKRAFPRQWQWPHAYLCGPAQGLRNLCKSASRQHTLSMQIVEMFPLNILNQDTTKQYLFVYPA